MVLNLHLSRCQLRSAASFSSDLRKPSQSTCGFSRVRFCTAADAGADGNETTATIESSEEPIIKTQKVFKARPPPPPPPKMKVKPSSAFVMRKTLSMQDKQAPMPPSTRPPLGKSNPLDNLLTSLDKNLDAAEQEPSAGIKAAWQVNRATNEVVNDPRVQKAAKATVEVGSEAIKAAIPVAKDFGKWALKKGLGVMSTIDEAANESKKSKGK